MSHTEMMSNLSYLIVYGDTETIRKTAILARRKLKRIEDLYEQYVDSCSLCSLTNECELCNIKEFMEVLDNVICDRL